jgi:hypothetical protein
MRNEERAWDLEPGIVILGALYAITIVAGVVAVASGLL